MLLAHRNAAAADRRSTPPHYDDVEQLCSQYHIEMLALPVNAEEFIGGVERAASRMYGQQRSLQNMDH